MRPAAFLTILVLLQASRPSSAQESLSGQLRTVGIEQRLNTQIPLDLLFHDESGQAVRLGAYFGSGPVILVLAYYRCPMLCTQVLNGLVDAIGPLTVEPGEHFQVVVVSFDARERPELAAAKKAAYLGRYGRPYTGGGWHFLTGPEDSITRLTSAVGFRYTYDPDKDQYAHASGIMILTPQGRLSRYFYGISFPSNDVRLSLVEASAGKIGSPVDQIVLLCYHFDPRTGKYTFAIMSLVRLGGILTLLILGGFVARSWWNDWRRKRQLPPTRE